MINNTGQGRVVEGREGQLRVCLMGSRVFRQINEVGSLFRCAIGGVLGVLERKNHYRSVGR